MMRLVDLALAPGILMLCALAAGLAAAFGRELNEGRQPGWQWWLSRILLLPCIAVLSAATEDVVPLNVNSRAALTVMLVLSGYDGIRRVQNRSLSRDLTQTKVSDLMEPQIGEAQETGRGGACSSAR